MWNIKIVLVTVLMKSYTVLLQIFIKIGFFQRLILNCQTTTLLVVQKKVIIPFIPSIETKMLPYKAFSWYKNPVSSKKLSKKVIIFIAAMLENKMFLHNVKIKIVRRCVRGKHWRYTKKAIKKFQGNNLAEF